MFNYLKLFSLLVCVVMFAFVGCKDIIEPNISEKTVNLLAPADSLTTFYSTQTFWWDEVVNANEYQLQIVTQDFDFIERLILDTTISTNKFSLSLYPSQYQWRVKALNYSYSTDYTTWTLIIDSTLDLTNQAIVLTNPATNDTTNQTSITFNWENLYNATVYIFQLEQEGVFIRDDTLSASQQTVNDLNDGDYKWRIKAVNAVSETSFFSRSLMVYTVLPEPPVLKLPQDKQEFGILDPVSFSWERDSESIPSISDNLLVSSDTSYNQIIIDKNCTNPEHGSSFEAGIYFWKVKSVDKAGNQSDFSTSRKFIVYNNRK